MGSSSSSSRCCRRLASCMHIDRWGRRSHCLELSVGTLVQVPVATEEGEQEGVEPAQPGLIVPVGDAAQNAAKPFSNVNPEQFERLKRAQLNQITNETQCKACAMQ